MLPNELMMGSFKSKLVNIVLENMQISVDIQQASGCFLEKYNDPEREVSLFFRIDKD